MGLDAVELVMEIERVFDISIPDDRLGQMVTVGDLYEFILEQTADASLKHSTCLSCATFLELRRQVRSLELPVSEFRPGSNVRSLVPWVRRRAVWKALSRRMDLEFPRLERPSWLSLLNCMLVTIVVFGCLFSLGSTRIGFGIVASAVGGILVATFLFLLTSPLAVCPSPTCLTIRALVTNLIALNYAKLTARYSTHHPQDTWNVLQMIVVEQLGVDPAAVVPHAELLRDLGAG